MICGKKVMLGAPVLQDRAFVIEKYLNAIFMLDYPMAFIDIAFLVNGKRQDNTLELLQDFQNTFEGIYNSITIKCIGGDHKDGRIERDYTLFADIRNQWLNMLGEEDDYIFSVDSDIILKPDTLQRLMGHKKDIVSPLVDNGFYKLKFPTYNMFDETGRHVQPTNGLRKVATSCGCHLIRREVIEAGCKYVPTETGEDFGFCKMAYDKGFECYIDQDHELKHVFKNP